MDPRPPLSRIVLPATSVADDLGFVALADMATAAAGREYRLIGGHMLTMLVARWQLGAGLYRETLDTDLGIPPTVAADPAVVDICSRCTTSRPLVIGSSARCQTLLRRFPIARRRQRSMCSCRATRLGRAKTVATVIVSS